MGHAAVAMVRRLRQAPGSTGLLYGQGEYVTKHHALLVASRPAGGHAALTEQYSVQARADSRRGLVPKFLDTYAGSAEVETFTVLYDRQSMPTHGAVIARASSGDRLMARVAPEDRDSIALLTDPARSPIGVAGSVRAGRDDVLEWSCG
jgi:hypothetical protein